MYVYVTEIMQSFLAGLEDSVEDMEEVSRAALLIHLWAGAMISNDEKIRNAHHGVNGVNVFYPGRSRRLHPRRKNKTT